MSATRFILQDCIRRGHVVEEATAALGAQLTLLPDRVTDQMLADLDAAVAEAGEKPIVFCSLPLAARIKARRPVLARGIDLDLEALRHSRYSALLPSSTLLNPDGIYLPWACLAPRRDLLRSLFGARVFLRPDRATKPFPGFDIGLDGLAAELAARAHTYLVEPGELVFVAPARDLPHVEFRVWLVEGTPVGAAAYSWHEGEPLLPVPEAVILAAAATARRLEGHLHDFTADFVLIEDRPSLVEVNGMATSGWYPDLDPKVLLAAIDAVFVG